MNIKRASTLVPVGVLIGLLVTSVIRTPATTAATATRTFTAEADAYVSASSPSKNYGTSNSLRVDGSPIQRAYVRFAVSSLAGPVVRATLRVYATRALSTGLAARTVAANGWDENTLTWTNAPAPAAAVAGSSAGFSSGWVAIDVTSAVTGGGAVTLAITNPSSNGIALRSRDAGAATAPQLVVETDVTPTATSPANTSAPTITGQAQQGATLTGHPGTWLGTLPITFRYQWLRCGAGAAGCAPIAGATTAEYTITAADVGSTLALSVTGSNTAGSSSATSAWTATVTAAPPPPPGATDPVVAAAGDIACTTAPVTTGSGCHYGLTASVIASDPSVTDVLTLGDLQYECGDYANFLRFYDPTWGLFRARTHPAIGNHEYLAVPTSGCDAASTVPAQGYFDYWNGVGAASGPAGSRDRGYHSFNVGSWHLIALNSNCSKAGGCGATSPQATWLRADLAAHPTACTLAYWHHPRFSSGEHGDNTSVAPLWEILYAAGVDVVLNGHDHDYERFAAQSPAGVAEPATGIREFVVGTGGKSHYTFTAVKPNSEVRNGDTFGVLKLTLHAHGYDWRFAPEAGRTFTDAGSDACH